MPLLLKLGIDLVCATLFWWGGFCWLPARRFIMPTLLMASSMILVGRIDWWLLTMLSCMGVFCLGYGVNSPLRHCFGNGWGRGVWGLLGAVALSLGLFLTGHVYIWLFLTYLTLNFILENALKDIPQFIGDPIIGVGFSSILFLIH